MERQVIVPRPDSKEKLEAVGLSFHEWDGYWKEDVCYKFTADEIDLIEGATRECHEMCIAAARHVIYKNRFNELGIPKEFHQAIRESFERDDFSLYGRFDFSFDGKNIKMLEYNADTPTSLLESAVAQWYWLNEKFPGKDQFNSLHEKLVERWKQFNHQGLGDIYFSSLEGNEEDWVCTHYLMDTAKQAGFNVKHITIEDVGYDKTKNTFVDLDDKTIFSMFKLYPWEWMMRESFGQFTIKTDTIFIEPMWKSLMSCKGLLPILWELFPKHPFLLESYFSLEKDTWPSASMAINGDFVTKPLYSREGANVKMFEKGTLIAEDEGPYGSEGLIIQALCKLPMHGGRYPVIGSWIVGDQPAGMCIREDDSPITTNMSNFIPHYFED